MGLIYPVKKVYITQDWGVNRDNYSKFGLLGHNGIDLRAFLPSGERCYEGGKSEVFAPHDGKIIENSFDSSYGWYSKIENDKEGSILAHFHSKSACVVGSYVLAGDLIGYQGTTGNSTGIHLHWGYYPKPRNKASGYSGTINQLLIMNDTNSQNKAPKTILVDLSDWEKMHKNSLSLDEITDFLSLERNSDGKVVTSAVQGLINDKIKLAEDLKLCQNEPKQIKIDKSIEVAGTKWEINGLNVQSDGLMIANYQKIS